MSVIRKVTHSSAAMPTSDGAGVKLKRALGTPETGTHDPFLLLDEFRSDNANDYIAGFPDHPHRGFETVTYMLAGKMRHADSTGHEGVIETGGVQWMTAGRGVVHSEMPEQSGGLLQGFQLWINLPADRKMSAPRYQEFKADDIPVWTAGNGVRAKVIAGCIENPEDGSVIDGPVAAPETRPTYLDIELPAGVDVDVPVKTNDSAFVYVFEGEIATGPDGDAIRVKSGEVAIFGQGDTVRLGTGGKPARALLLAGRPLGEPIAWSGPFVMNTRDELMQAFEDYRAGRFTGGV